MLISCLQETTTDIDSLKDKCKVIEELIKLKENDEPDGKLIHNNINGHALYQLALTTDTDEPCSILYQLPAKDKMLIIWIGVVETDNNKTPNILNLAVVRLENPQKPFES